MIRRTRTFQKVYDLPLNFVPDDIDQTKPTDKEYARFIIRRTLRALGIAYAKEISWRARRVKGNLVKNELRKWYRKGRLKM